MKITSLIGQKGIVKTEQFVLFLVIALCFIAYFQIRNFQFLHWDDDAQIVKNVYVRNLDLKSITHNFNSESFTFFTLTVYSIIYKIWGNNPAPFHWFSLIIHLINILLLFRLIRYFTQNVYTISLVLILFALHPMRVESVAWISELKDLLFSFFSLISFLLYFKYLKKNLNIIFFVLSAIMAVLASLSKIQGILVPVSFFLIDFYCKRKISLCFFIEKLFIILIFYSVFISFSYKFFVLGSIIFIICYIYEKGVIKKTTSILSKKILIGILLFISVLAVFLFYFNFPNVGISFWSENPDNSNSFSFFERVLLAGYSLWFYFKNLFFPVFFNAVHPYPVRIDGYLPLDYYLTLFFLVFVISLSVIIIIRRKKVPSSIIFGWFFFLINISLVLHIIPIEGRLVVADRYSYLPYLGLFISLATLFEKFVFNRIKSQKILIVALLLLSITLTFLTNSRCKTWRDTKTLFSDVIKKNQNIPFAYCSIASYYMECKLPDSAILNFNNAVRLDSTFSLAYYNRAFAFLENKNYKNAIDDFTTFINIVNDKKAKARAYDNLGKIFRIIGNDTVGLEYFNTALKYDSNLVTAYNNRGVYYLNNGRISEAVSDFVKAVKLNIYYAEAYNNLGAALMADGDMNGAEKNFNRSLTLDPMYKLAYDNRGYLKYLSNDAAGAIKDFNISINLDNTSVQTYIKRGRAYAQMKNYNAAIEDFTFVLKKDPHNMVALTNRAYAYFYKNDFAKAEFDFNAVVEYYPENSIAYQNVAWFHMQNKNYQKAIDEYLVSIQKDKLANVSYINLAWIYIELKEYNKAEKILIDFLKIKPESQDSFFLFGELNRKKGNTEKACEYYKKASDLGSQQAKNAYNSFCAKR